MTLLSNNYLFEGADDFRESIPINTLASYFENALQHEAVYVKNEWQMKTALDYLIYLEDAKGTNHHENIGVLASLAGPVVDKYYFSNPAMKWLDNWYGEAIYTYGLKFFYFQYVADVDMERFA